MPLPRFGNIQKAYLEVGIVTSRALRVAGMSWTIIAVVRVSLPPAACKWGLWALLAWVWILGIGRTLPLGACCKGILCSLQNSSSVKSCQEPSK